MLEPTAVALQAAFLAVLYLFVVWVASSSLRDLRRPDEARAVVPPPVAASRRRGHARGLGRDRAAADRRARPGPHAGDGVRDRRGRRDGPRGPGRDPARGPVRLRPPRAAHPPAAAIVVLEDLGSTNGTYLNEELVTGPQPLHRGDRVRIGDSEFTYVDR